MSRVVLLPLAAVLTLLCSATGARCEFLSADVSFTEIQSEIRPRRKDWHQPRRITMSLIDGHVVKERQARRTGRPDEHVKTFETTLGAETHVRQSLVRWWYEGNGTLVRQAETSSYVTTIRLRFRAGLCSGEVSYVLRPPATYFAMRRLESGKPMIVDRLRAEDVTCTIREDVVS